MILQPCHDRHLIKTNPLPPLKWLKSFVACFFLSSLLKVCSLMPHRVTKGLCCSAGLQMRSLNGENRRGRWRRRDKHKVLARRRLLRGFLLNYVMEHVRGLIGGLWSYAASYGVPVPAHCASPPQPIICRASIISKCDEECSWIIQYLWCSDSVPEKWTSELQPNIHQCTLITVESKRTDQREVGYGLKDMIKRARLAHMSS